MVTTFLSGPTSIRLTEHTATAAATIQVTEWVSLRRASWGMRPLPDASVTAIAATSATTIAASCGATDCKTAKTSSMLISSMSSPPLSKLLVFAHLRRLTRQLYERGLKARRALGHSVVFLTALGAQRPFTGAARDRLQ